MSRKGWQALATLSLVGAMGAALFLRPQPPLPRYGQVPDFAFTAHTGETLSLRDLLGHVWVADFFFTSCAGICPTMTAQMQRVQKAFRGHPQVRIVSFTVDPQTDTVEILAQYARGWGAQPGQWYFLTGEKKAIYALARQGFKVTATQGDGGPRDFIHSDRFVLVDRQGRIRGYYQGTDPKAVDALLRDLRRLLKER